MLQIQLKYNIKYDQKYPQSFTGKERDSETGFSYFGARYYDSDILTGWLSVDPLADKYPGLSPYAYCAWNPVKLVDPDGRDWYENENNYYWSDKVINKETTPNGCNYIGDDKSLLKYFGFPISSLNKNDKQLVQTVVGSNVESTNPYESKYYAFGSVCAKSKSSINYIIQKGEKTGKLYGIKINANLETTVYDYGVGGRVAAYLDVFCGNEKNSIPFRPNNGDSFMPKDYNSREYLNVSITISADKLSANCVSKLQIKGPWFSQNRPMTVPFTLGIIPSYLKHNYLK